MCCCHVEIQSYENDLVLQLTASAFVLKNTFFWCHHSGSSDSPMASYLHLGHFTFMRMHLGAIRTLYCVFYPSDLMICFQYRSIDQLHVVLSLARRFLHIFKKKNPGRDHFCAGPWWQKRWEGIFKWTIIVFLCLLINNVDLCEIVLTWASTMVYFWM